MSEIVIQFHKVPHSIFPPGVGVIEPNRLIIRLQPDDGIQLTLMAKDPGPGGMRLRMAPLDIRFADAFKVRYPDAYERLLMDVVRGNATLFMRRDEVEAAWRWVEPILEAWAQSDEAPKPYLAGSWGPTAAIALIERDGRTWFEDATDGSATGETRHAPAPRHRRRHRPDPPAQRRQPRRLSGAARRWPPRGPRRTALSCGNLAHGFAACGDARQGAPGGRTGPTSASSPPTTTCSRRTSPTSASPS